MNDKIEEIRERWAEFESLDHQSQVWDSHLYMRRAHNDRAFLLAEDERHRAKIERLRAALKGIDALEPDVPDALGADALRVIVAQMGDLAVKALEGEA